MMAKPADKMINSGNSRVKVTVYGQVNKAFRLDQSAGASNIDIVDNDGASSRIGIRAVGKANPNLTIGGWHELEWQENRRSGTGAEGNTRVRARHVDLWVDHKNLGQVWMGHGSIAADAVDLFANTGTGHIFGSAGVAADGTSANGESRGYRNFAFFGARENRIMYVTPSLMGGRLRLSYGENKSLSAAVRYFGAPPGVKSFSASFAAGFRQDPNEHDDTAAQRTAWGVSGGITHTPSGFNVSGGYGAERRKGSAVKPYNWYVEGGWTGKINDAGATNFGVGYFASSDGRMGSAQQYWIAVNQNVTAAAADVYFGAAYDSGSNTMAAIAAIAGMPAVAGMEAVEVADAGPDSFMGQNPDNNVALATLADRTGGGTETGYEYQDGEQIHPDDLSNEVDNTVYTFVAGTPAVEAADATDGSAATKGTAAQPAREVKRDGVFIFIAGVRIKF